MAGPHAACLLPDGRLFLQMTRVKGSDCADGDEFGFNIAVHRGIAVVAASSHVGMTAHTIIFHYRTVHEDEA